MKIFCSLRTWWRSSLIPRVMIIVLTIGVVTTIIASSLVSTQTRNRLYSRAVEASTQHFEAARSQAQYVLDSAHAPTSGQLQQLANTLVANQYEPTHGVNAVALIRSADNKETSYLVADAGIPSVANILDVLTPDLAASVKNGHMLWQPVSFTDADGEKLPGILVATPLQLAQAGEYDFYILYSLQSQEETVGQVTRLLVLASLSLLVIVLGAIYVITRMVLRPVRQASRLARHMASGAFDVRMDDSGQDELAHLGASFNQMAESLQDQIGRLERLSRVQQNFVSAVSHELRTPVTTIRMAGQLMYDKRDELPAYLKRSAELQHSQLIAMDAMLADLLEISRFDAGSMVLEPNDTDVAQLAQRVILNQAPLIADNGVTIRLWVEGTTRINVDSRRVERIIRNLVVNAVEHAEGGQVKVRIVGGEKGLAVEVSDLGVGMSPEQCEHVFDRFWRADSSRVRKSGGTGLGLTISREDALLHHGNLQASGELGVGSTFLLTLPVDESVKLVSPLPLRIAAKEPWEEKTGTEIALDIAGNTVQPCTENGDNHGNT